MPVELDKIPEIHAAFGVENMLEVRDKTWAEIDGAVEKIRAMEREMLRNFSDKAAHARDNKVACFYLNANDALCRGLVVDIFPFAANNMRVRMCDLDFFEKGSVSAMDKYEIPYSNILSFGEPSPQK